MCPPFSHRTVALSNREVQKQVRSFLDDGSPGAAVLERARLCNECYKCVTDTCPQGLDPMRTNQLLRGLLNDMGLDPRPFMPPKGPRSNERIAAAALTTDEEYQRITTPAVKGSGRILFFPGCNIYYQPDLLLTALDIMDVITDDWAFLPGMDHCCGGNFDSSGRLEAGGEAGEELAETLKASGAEIVTVWCSTCAARFHHAGPDLRVIHFARFLADRLGDFIKGKGSAGTITLHETCKTAYLGLDPQAPRDLLNLLGDEPVLEMARHGTGTVCCGWSLHENKPEIWKRERQKRLAEAEATGAKTLVTVCHGCQWYLNAPGADHDVRIVNFIQLVGEALGIRTG